MPVYLICVHVSVILYIYEFVCMFVYNVIAQLGDASVFDALVCECVSIYVYVSVCMFVYKVPYVQTYTQTYRHT